MYQVENSGDLIKNERRIRWLHWQGIGRTVFLLGVTSLLTDISSEMVSTTLPLYLLFTLRLAPLQFGLIDGLYQGAAALVRLVGGIVADRRQQPKEVAASGYGFSALCKLGLLAVGSNWFALASVVLLDRIGKGIRTAPRDALIAASTAPSQLATAFGIHRAMDTAGAMIGPLLAAGLLLWLPGAYDAIFVLSFCFAVIGLAVIVLFVGNPNAASTEASEPVKRQMAWQTTLHLLNDPPFRRLLLIGTLLAFVTLSDSFLFLLIERNLTLGSGFFPLLYVATAGIFMLFAIPVGRLADRLGRQRIFLAGYTLLAVAYALLLLPTLTWFIAVVVLILIGLYYAATDGVLAALGSALLPTATRTTGLALLMTGTGLARLFASTLYGALWSWRGPEAALLIFLGALLLVIVAAPLLLRVIKQDEQ